MVCLPFLKENGESKIPPIVPVFWKKRYIQQGSALRAREQKSGVAFNSSSSFQSGHALLTPKLKNS